jgi:large subunit ribosomal protein L30e
VKKMAKETDTDFKKILKTKNLVIGTEKTIKELRLTKLATVFVTKNAPEKIRADVNHYAKLTKTEVTNLKYTNEELGELCKKPFSISVLGVLK